MGKLIFDYKDGDLIHIMSEQTAIDMDAALSSSSSHMKSTR